VRRFLLQALRVLLKIARGFCIGLVVGLFALMFVGAAACVVFGLWEAFLWIVGQVGHAWRGT
jgi:hypothetical protein